MSLLNDQRVAPVFRRLREDAVQSGVSFGERLISCSVSAFDQPGTFAAIRSCFQEMSCPFCEGNNMIKWGLTPHGRINIQQFRCASKDCRRCFNEYLLTPVARLEMSAADWLFFYFARRSLGEPLLTYRELVPILARSERTLKYWGKFALRITRGAGGLCNAESGPTLYPRRAGQPYADDPHPPKMPWTRRSESDWLRPEELFVTDRTLSFKIKFHLVESPTSGIHQLRVEFISEKPFVSYPLSGYEPRKRRHYRTVVDDEVKRRRAET